MSLNLNPIKPTAWFYTHILLKTLLKGLLNTTVYVSFIIWLIVYTVRLTSKRHFRTTFRLWLTSFCHEILADFNKINVRINFISLIIPQDEHLLDWSNFFVYLIIRGWFIYLFLNLLFLSVKYDHQAFVERFFFYLSMYCIACLGLQRFNHKTKHLNINLLTHYCEIYSDNWYLYAFVCCTVLKISLIYKVSELN